MFDFLPHLLLIYYLFEEKLLIFRQISLLTFFFLQKIEVFMIREYRELCDLDNIVCT